MAGKAQKRKQAPRREPWQRAAMAALDLAAEKGWDNVTLEDVARRAGTDAAALRALYADKRDLVPVISQYMDAEMEADSRELAADMAVRDRLFDVMMARFEALNRHRAGIVSIMGQVVTSPRDLLSFFPSLRGSMQKIAVLAHLPEGGLCGETRSMALLAVYLATLKTWRGDDSADLAATMAALDKNLAHSETLAGLFN